MNFSENALKVLKARYLLEGESPEDMFRRVANFLGDTKEEKEGFYKVMTELKFLPNSPTLMNAGTVTNMLSACFVLPIEDSIESIFTTLKNTVMIHKQGGGTGFNFSSIRPKGSPVKGTAGTASGPLSFIRVFNAATEEIKQGGRRKGANMGILNIDHPDIIEFIKAKTVEGEYQNFNFSVAVTDKFMQAVNQDKLWKLHHPASINTPEIPARELWKLLCESTHKYGEPGIIFLDTINTNVDMTQKMYATNPCGEIPLLPYESCNLGSINLSQFVHFGIDKPSINFSELHKTIATAIHMLNRVIDKNQYTIPEIKRAVTQNRKIGLGVMGLHDALIKLGLRYDTAEARKCTDDIMATIYFEGKRVSDAHGYSNTTITTIAPTGSLSIIADCSSGIEPHFAYEYHKNVIDSSLKVESSILPWLYRRYKVFSKEQLPNKVKDTLITASEINWKNHINMQALVQKNVDNSISKTINMPNATTIEDVEQAIMHAWSQKCKGITIYRDGSREYQVLEIKKSSRVKVADSSRPYPKRPAELAGKTIRTKITCGNLFISINKHNKKPFEVFCNMGKAGGCEGSQMEALGRIISLSLKYGASLEKISRHLRGIQCNKPRGLGKGAKLSCADAVAQVLAQECNIDVQGVKKAGGCPECGSSMNIEEGCEKCLSCGYSRCN